MENYGGSMVQPGKWVNLHTGHEVFVRDTIQDGDQMMVLTDSGQIPMKEFTNYIQIEEGEIIPSLQDVYGTQNKSLQAQINQGIPIEDRIDLNNNIKENNNSKLLEGLGETKQVKTNNTKTIENNNETKIVNQPVEVNKNYDLIKKVFDKFPIERSLDFYIVEEEWPFKEFNMLVNILDVPVEDICSYVIDNYLNKGKLVEALTQYFNQFIK